MPVVRIQYDKYDRLAWTSRCRQKRRIREKGSPRGALPVRGAGGNAGYSRGLLGGS